MITSVHLGVHARMPGADAEAFEAAAGGARQNCPVSKLFNAGITIDTLLSAET